jgi:hypothetical protein
MYDNSGRCANVMLQPMSDALLRERWPGGLLQCNMYDNFRYPVGLWRLS